MALSVILSGDVEAVGRTDMAAALQFARGGLRDGDEPSTRSASSALVVRRGGGDARRGETLGFIATKRQAASSSATGDVFLIDGLRVHPDLAGFSPGAHRLLIALAVMRLAWTEADNEATRAFVAIRVRAEDRRVCEDLHMLRARRLPHPIVVEHGLHAMSADLPTTARVEYWEITPEAARHCAMLIRLQKVADDPWRVDRDSGIRQQLSLTLDLRWLKVCGEPLDDLADGTVRLDWGPLPQIGSDAGEVRTADRERPDGDKPIA